MRLVQQNVNNRLISSSLTLKQSQFDVLPGFSVVYKQFNLNYSRDVNLPDWSATCARLRAEHRAILAAVNNNDGGTAAALVAAHIQGFYKEAGVGSSHGS